MPNDSSNYKLVVTPRLQELIKQSGMTQTQLAEKANIPQPYISRFDNQKLHSDHVLFSLAAALNCNIQDLFTVAYEKI
jgi:putative transcriptional regulator